MQVTPAAPRLELEPQRFARWGRTAWGYGAAILARDRLSGLPIAWQSFPKVSASAWRRFRAVAHPLSRPIHPGVARLVDSGREERSAWVAEEWIPGTWSLNEWRAGAPISASHLRDLLIHFASALGALHRAGIVHGDLSPESLRVVGAEGRIDHPWIVGSGTWLLADPRSRTRAQRWAPEVLSGQEPTFRSDVYGLGQSLRARFATELDLVASGAAEPQPLARVAALLQTLVAPDPAARPPDGESVARLARELPRFARQRGSDSTAAGALPQVGRARSLILANDILARAARGEVHALEIRGPSGSGKSAFLTQLAAEARGRGFQVLALDLRSGTTADPEQALVQALARALGWVFSADPKPEAAHPELTWARFARELGRAIDRTRIRLCLILDPATGSAAEVLHFLRYLSSELGSRPFLVCLARTAPAHFPASEVIALEPLDGRAIEQLLCASVVSNPEALALAPALRAATDGWPLALRLALEPWRPDAERGSRVGAPAALVSPARSSLAAQVTAAIAGLSPDARARAELLALWDGRLPRPIAARLWPQANPAADLPDWLVSVSDAGEIALGSECGRQALLDALPADRRARGHARLLAALGVDPEHRSAVAAHAIGAGEAEIGARAALAAARRARALGRGAAALEHYRQALAAASVAAGAIDLAAAAFEAAELAIAMGEWLVASEALAAFDRTHEDAPVPAALRFEALLARAQVLRERRLLGEARSAIADAHALAIRAPEELGPAPQARIDLEASAIDFMAGDGPAGEQKLARVLPQLIAAGRHDLLPVAWNRLATLRSVAGEPRDALLLALTAARRARGLETEEIRIRALVNGAFFAFQLDRRRQAIRLLDRARALLVRAPHSGLRVSELVHRAELLALERRFAEAEAALVEARRVRLQSGGRSRLPAILITLGNLRSRCGRLKSAAAAYDEAIALAEELGTPELHSARGNLGALLDRMGETREAERLIRLGLADSRPDRRGLGLLNLAALLRRSGRLEAAAAALDEAQAALEGRYPIGERRARVERARLRLAAGDPQGALTELGALGAPDDQDPAGMAEEHMTAALARAEAGRDPYPSWTRALASAETAGDPTLLAEVLIEALAWANTGPEELAARPDVIQTWLLALARAARATDAPPIAHALRSLTPEAPPPARGAPREFGELGLADRLLALATERGSEDSFAARLERELEPWGARSGAVIVALDLDVDRRREAAGSPAGREPQVRPYRTALRAFDRELFRAALARTGGQVPAAARLLRLPESTFRYRAGKAGVLRPRTTEPKPDS